MFRRSFVFTMTAAMLLTFAGFARGESTTSSAAATAPADTTETLMRLFFSDAGVTSRTVVYKETTSAQLTLDVFQPATRKQGEPLPCIVFFFGGGWKGGSPQLFHPQCRYFARRGMVAIAADYRTENRHGTTPFECVADGKSAVRWIRAHAGELGIDPNRIAVGGGSAGGHVAAATAMLARFDEPGEDHSVSSKPNALVLFNPVVDNSPAGYGNARIGERWQDFSPMHNVKPGAPPAVVLLGTKDHLIPIATAKKFQKLMQDAGARCDLYLYEGQPHGFYGARKGRTNPYLAVTVYHADKFLTSLGYTKGDIPLPEPQVKFTGP